MLTLNVPFDQPCGTVLAGKVCIFEPLKKLMVISKNKVKEGEMPAKQISAHCHLRVSQARLCNTSVAEEFWCLGATILVNHAGTKPELPMLSYIQM